MTSRTSFYRKIAYMAGLVVLAYPIFSLSEPQTPKSKGGQLAQLREENRLGQANLGEVDPASETMRFLTLGLRGVAVTLLWDKANYYKKVEDWTNLTATLEQLAKLQPNFLIFWEYQAWNLTYNVSVEFDDYHDRYYYVIRGINFLKEGERYNADEPRLLSDLGWFIGHKIGRADERVLYRRLFKNDPDFHPPNLPLDERDNWLVSKSWYQRAIEAVDIKHKPLLKKNPREFYSDPAKSQMSYAEAIEKEGQFAKGQRAWAQGGDEWRQFGHRPIPHSFGPLLRLGEEEHLKQEVDKLRTELEQMSPGLREKLVAEKRQGLSDDERVLVDMPLSDVPSDRSSERYSLMSKIDVTDQDVAERIAREQPGQAQEVQKLGRRIEEEARVLQLTQAYKQIVNFDYWQMRCDFEQTDNAVAARELMFEADKAAKSADEQRAADLYQQAFAKWRLVVDQFPALLKEETVFGDELVTATRDYREVLESIGKSLDESYPLWDALQSFDKEKRFDADIARHREAQDTTQSDNKDKSPNQ